MSKAAITPSLDFSKLPPNYGRNALSFNAEDDVGELPAFLENIEAICKKVGALKAEDEKWVALHYCTSKTKEQWKSLVTFADGYSWDDFKEELRLSYPELKEAEKGSLKVIRTLSERTARRPIKINDMVGLQAFHMDFRSIMRKLLEPTPRILNREAVAFYLKGLSTELKSQVKGVIRVTARESLTSYKKAKEAWDLAHKATGAIYVAPSIDEDDKYAWSDLLDIAVTIVLEESSGMFEQETTPPSEGKKNATMVLLQDTKGDHDVGITPAVKILAEKFSKLEADTRELHRKEAKEKEDFHKEVSDQLANAFATHMDKFTADQHKELQQIRMAVEGKRSDYSVQPSNHRSAGPSFIKNRTTSSMDCYYCYEPGHFILECPNLKADVEKGVVRMENNRAKFYDGKNVPREPPNKSPRDKAHEYYSRRTVSQSYDQIMGQFFDGEEVGEETIREPPRDSTLNQVLAAIERLTRSKALAESAADFQ
jgi:hypothetical protein